MNRTSNGYFHRRFLAGGNVIAVGLLFHQNLVFIKDKPKDLFFFHAYSLFFVIQATEGRRIVEDSVQKISST